MRDPYYTLDTIRPQTSLGYLVKRVYRLAHAQVQAAFDDGEFTFTQWVALSLLRGGMAETASGLAREIGHDTGAMTRVIDQLAQAGLVERHPDPSDRRVTKLSVTKEGEAALRRTTPRVMDIWNLLLADFPRADVDRFIAMLTIMEGKLLRMEADRAERAGADA
ncbi:MAG: MarR family transcriptional regulator [Sphingobium sp.]|nr:MarR family transcriptional regulator [Sphingobium sp.]